MLRHFNKLEILHQIVQKHDFQNIDFFVFWKCIMYSVHANYQVLDWSLSRLSDSIKSCIQATKPIDLIWCLLFWVWKQNFLLLHFVLLALNLFSYTFFTKALNKMKTVNYLLAKDIYYKCKNTVKEILWGWSFRWRW